MKSAGLIKHITNIAIVEELYRIHVHCAEYVSIQVAPPQVQRSLRLNYLSAEPRWQYLSRDFREKYCKVFCQFKAQAFIIFTLLSSMHISFNKVQKFYLVLFRATFLHLFVEELVKRLDTV